MVWRDLGLNPGLPDYWRTVKHPLNMNNYFQRCIVNGRTLVGDVWPNNTVSSHCTCIHRLYKYDCTADVWNTYKQYILVHRQSTRGSHAMRITNPSSDNTANSSWLYIALPIGFKTMEDLILLPATTEALPYLNLVQQLIEIQKENTDLRKQGTLDWPNRNNYVWKPERPTVGLDSSESDWALFLDTWGWYKEMCQLTNPAVIHNELRTACALELNWLLFNLLGAKALDFASEDQLLQHIRLIMIRGLHKEVHWQNFHSMRQKERKLITHFLARLQTLAKFCNLAVTYPNKLDCGWHVDYSNDMVANEDVGRSYRPHHIVTNLTG